MCDPLGPYISLVNDSINLITLFGLPYQLTISTYRLIDGELSQHKNTRVPSEPRYELRKRNHSQNQQKRILLLIHKYEKLYIHEMNEEDLSKTFKESVDPKGIIFPPPPPNFYNDLKIDLVICN